MKRLCNGPYYETLPEDIEDLSVDAISDLIKDVAETVTYHSLFGEFVLSKVTAWYADLSADGEGKLHSFQVCLISTRKCCSSCH